jgi:transcriptional regulator with XRE-family HTH domain
MSVAFNVPKLRRALLARGWSRGDFRVRVGLSEATITNILKGRQVSEDTWRRVEEALSAAPIVSDLDLLEKSA